MQISEKVKGANTNISFMTNVFQNDYIIFYDYVDFSKIFKNPSRF